MQGRTVRTPKKRNAVLAKLAEGYSINAACVAAGMGRSAYFAWVQDDPDFARDTEAAIETGTDLLEDEAKKRAMGMMGSDTLLIFLLKGRRPEKYRENQKITHEGDMTISVRYEDDHTHPS